MEVVTRNKIATFKAGHIESICRVIADTQTGLTGSEIARLLKQCSIPDVDPGNTKWRRLFNAFVEFQNQIQAGNHIIKFVEHAMDPVLYTNCPEVLRTKRSELNVIFALIGMNLSDDGKFRKVTVAQNLDEALARECRMRSELERRAVHPDVLRFCKAEIISENYFHAVLEAMKSITSKIREKSGETSDGADLVDKAFSLGKSMNPVLCINTLQSESEQGEQKGFANLLKGLYGVIRNPVAHEPKIQWNMTEQDALDMLTTISLVLRKLDKAHKH